MTSYTSTPTPERRSGRTTTKAVDRHFAASVERMAACIIDQLVRGEAADEGGLAQYGFLKSEIAEMKEAAMAEARKARPELFRMEAA